MTSAPTVGIARDSVPGQSGHIFALDGLRCLAVGQVMLNHFVMAARPEGASAVNVFQFFGNGVYLFFVLSGFLITGILLKAKGSDSYFSTFYARRTLRIFPLYYAVLLACFGGLWVYRVAGHQLSAEATHAFNTQGWLWLYLTNFSQGLFGQEHEFGLFKFGHFWTLAVEEQFYLVWPLVVFILNRDWLKRVCVAACIALVVGRIYFQWRGLQEVNFYLLSSDGLFIGSWLAVATTARGPSPTTAKRSAVFVVIAFIVCIGLTGGPIVARSSIVPAALAKVINLCSSPLLKTAQCLMFAGLLMFAISAARGSILRRIFEWKPAVYIGKISYGIYVYHVLLMGVFILIAQQTVGRLTSQPKVLWFSTVAICVVLSILVAAISWKLFEQPVLRLKDRFNYKPHSGSRATADNVKPA